MVVFILLIVFQLKHYFSDFPLQNSYMLQKFKDKGWVLPLTAHSGVHALMTFLIVIIYQSVYHDMNHIEIRISYMAVALTLLDFTIHFSMDRIKASSKMLGRYKVLDGLRIQALTESKNNYLRILKKKKDSHALKELVWIENQFKGNKYFWFALGLDQMIHHLTHYLIIYLLVMK